MFEPSALSFETHGLLPTGVVETPLLRWALRATSLPAGWKRRKVAVGWTPGVFPQHLRNMGSLPK